MAKRTPGRLLAKLVPLFFILIALGVVLFQQRIVDTVNYYTYQPSDAIAKIAETTTMQGDGKFYFYASRPELKSASDFNAFCRNNGEQGALLGCYSKREIAIYDVNDSRLNGIKEVTAAHEMLHAAWDRLDDSTRKWLEQELKLTYEAHKTPELEKRMAMYAETEPGEHYNELHSILGTEIASLPGSLETYYKRYFADRSAIAKQYAQYHGVFETLTKQLRTLGDEINNERPQYLAKVAAHNQQVTTLKADIEQFNNRSETGYFTSDAAFTQARSRILQRQDALSSEGTQLQQQQAAFNQKVKRYNQLAEQSNELNQIINSKNSENIKEVHE